MSHRPEVEALNPYTRENVTVRRRRLVVDEELLFRDDYSTFLKQFIPEILLGER